MASLTERSPSKSKATTTQQAPPITSARAALAYDLLDKLLKGNPRIKDLFGKYGGGFDLSSLMTAAQQPGAFDTTIQQSGEQQPAGVSTLESLGEGALTLALLSELLGSGSKATSGLSNLAGIFGKSQTGAGPPIYSIGGVPMNLWEYSMMPSSQPYGIGAPPVIDYAKTAPSSGGGGSSTFLNWLGQYFR